MAQETFERKLTCNEHKKHGAGKHNMFSQPTCAEVIAFGCSIDVKHNLLCDALLSKDKLFNRSRSMISQQIRMQSKEFTDTEQQRGLKIQKSLLK